LYPNPFHEYIQLKSSQDIKRIEVRDCLGNILEHYDTISDKIYLGKELQSGTYFVLIYTEKGIQIENIIKSRFSVNR
jgi:hypothetical protein